MKVFKKVVTIYLLISTPLVLLTFIWAFIINGNANRIPSTCLLVLWDALGTNVIIWMVVSIYFLISMVFSESMKNLTLAKLAGMKQRDEREERIVGNASKLAFLSTMTILLILLFISFFSVTFKKKSIEAARINEKRSSISISTPFKLIETEPINKENEGFEFYYQYKEIPITKTALIAFILVWHFLSYRYFARKINRIN